MTIRSDFDFFLGVAADGTASNSSLARGTCGDIYDSWECFGAGDATWAAGCGEWIVEGLAEIVDITVAFGSLSTRS